MGLSQFGHWHIAGEHLALLTNLHLVGPILKSCDARTLYLMGCGRPSELFLSTSQPTFSSTFLWPPSKTVPAKIKIMIASVGYG